MDLENLHHLIRKDSTSIFLLCLDGLGGLPLEQGGPTELEAAHTPNLDRLATEGICGLQQPVATGITPGSGPGHLGLFGYDPLQFQVGRGVLAALGTDFPLQDGDVAARGNFCTTDDQGRVTDRRACRISTEENRRLCELLQDISLPDIEIFVRTIKEHRFLLVLRGEGVVANLTDTDPQETGKAPFPPRAGSKDSEKTAKLVEQFVAQATERLADHFPANMVLLRGFAKRPHWPLFPKVFGLRAAAVAAYPMYRGLAKLVGMEVFPCDEDWSQKLDIIRRYRNDFDFFFIHVKGTDSAGENGDFDRKVRIIEEADRQIPLLMELNPDVLLVTGDHSTPSLLKAHSWHPVPVLLYADTCRPDRVQAFGERFCLDGALGARIPSVQLMPLALAHAGRLIKFGA